MPTPEYSDDGMNDAHATSEGTTEELRECTYQTVLFDEPEINIPLSSSEVNAEVNSHEK